MRYVIGVDLGGTQVRAIRCDPQGNIVAHARTDTAATAGPAAVVHQIERIIAEVRGDVPDYAVVAGSPARIVRRWVEGVGWDPPMRDVTMHKPDGWDDD